MILTEEEFLEWKEHPVTKEFFKVLTLTRENLKENLIRDLYDNDEFVKGKATALLELLEMTFNEIKEVTYGK